MVSAFFILLAKKQRDLVSQTSVYERIGRQVLPETSQTYILSANLLRQLQ